jgi:hypothetical protein
MSLGCTSTELVAIRVSIYSISSQNVGVVVGCVPIVVVGPDERVEPIVDNVTSVVSVEPDGTVEADVLSDSGVVSVTEASVVATYKFRRFSKSLYLFDNVGKAKHLLTFCRRGRQVFIAYNH